MHIASTSVQLIALHSQACSDLDNKQLIYKQTRGQEKVTSGYVASALVL